MLLSLRDLNLLVSKGQADSSSSPPPTEPLIIAWPCNLCFYVFKFKNTLGGPEPYFLRSHLFRTDKKEKIEKRNLDEMFPHLLFIET